MNFAPLFAAPAPIALHAIAALCALAFGIFQLVAPKGTVLHIWTGRVWVLAMLIVAMSSLFIFELRILGPISPIHIVSLVTLYYLISGVRSARNGNIRQHRFIMRSLFWLSLVVTGWFTLLPGRIMYQVVFGG